MSLNEQFGCPFSLLNDEQMSNWLGVEHQPDCFDNKLSGQIIATSRPISPKREPRKGNPLISGKHLCLPGNSLRPFWDG